MHLFTKGILFTISLLIASVTYAQQTYYISNSGSDSNSGTSESKPWKSISKVNSHGLNPGDKILFKRGDKWNEELRPSRNGSSGKLITFSAYGSGNKPVISAPSGAYTINIREKSYIRIDGIYAITPPNGNGIAIRGNSVGNEILNCTVEGRGEAGKGIVFSSPLNGNVATRSKIQNNEVFRTAYGIDGSFGMSGGGLIENNYIHDIRDGGGDGIVARRGNYNGLLIRNNEITGWRDDAIDFYGGNNIIVEYNNIHHVAAKVNTAGNGIKAGGANYASSNNVVRYNIIHALRGNSGGSKDGINCNGGDDTEIYGNIVYDVQGEALSVPKESKNIKIYHNTLVSDNRALFVASTSGIMVSNNILWGSRGALNINMRISGKNNLFVGGINDDNYSGSGDVIASAAAVFADASRNDYRLKSSSPAIDKGTRIAGYSSSIEKKSITGNPDIGAYEHGGGSTPSPTNELKVNAGEDNSMVLPVNSISLEASASGAGDASVSYQWSKKSGPSATLKNATRSKVDVSNMLEGTYVFAVTARANGQSASDEVRIVVKPKSGDDSPDVPNSPPSGNNGLRYQYYEGTWTSLPNFASQSVRKQGTVSNFTAGVRQREENFGIVFSGSIQINTRGTYTFYTTSDDGSKLYIDGKQVVNNDGRHGARERSGSINLSSGRHKIEVRFFESTRNQVLEVRYAGPGISKRTIPDGVLFPEAGETPPNDPTPEPPSSPQPPTAGKNGLRYKYYEGRWGALPNFSSLPVIKSGTLTNFSLSPARTDRYFGLVYSGYIRVAQSGSYTFYTTSDDGSKLYINDKQIVDNDKVHPARERSGSVSLSAGYHKIEVRYFENAHGEELSVRYNGPGVSKRAIPSSVLYLDRPSNARTATASVKEKEPKKAIVAAQEPASEAVVYPVPLEEELAIDLGSDGTEQAVEVTLTDRIGKTILQKSLLPQQGSPLVLYLGEVELLTGVYFVNVTTQEGSLSTFKVIKK